MTNGNDNTSVALLALVLAIDNIAGNKGGLDKNNHFSEG